MSRGFGATLGSASTDAITSGTSISYQSTQSFSMWLWRAGTGGGGLGIPFFENSLNGPGMQSVGTGTELRFYQNFSITDGEFDIADPGTGAWYHMGITYDGTSILNLPVIYINGSSVTVTANASPVGTFTASSGTMVVGNRPPTANRVWDGKIADFAFWNSTILTAAEISSLFHGLSPLMVRKAALTMYFPLLGTESGEVDLGPSHYTMTVTGTARQSQPRVMPAQARP